MFRRRDRTVPRWFRRCRPRRSRPGHPAAAWPCATTALVVIWPVAVKAPVDGSYISALAVAILAFTEVEPPATSTLPSSSSVDVWSARAEVILPVAVNAPGDCANKAIALAELNASARMIPLAVCFTSGPSRIAGRGAPFKIARYIQPGSSTAPGRRRPACLVEYRPRSA